MRITKVTTKTGDTGQTGLGNGERISKNSLRVTQWEQCKLNSIIGWVRIESTKRSDKPLEEIQQDLFNLGGELAIPDVEINLLKDSRVIGLIQILMKLMLYFHHLMNLFFLEEQNLPPECILPGLNVEILKELL